MENEIATREEQLNDFDRARRREALAALAELAASGKIAMPPLKGMVNVHFHTFFSFNYRNWSPSRIVWEAKKRGLDVAGSVDFDVLDAMGEMFEAGEVLAVRTNVALETRVFAHEFPDREFSSPGEPGVLYFMGTGFTRLPEPGSNAASCLERMRAGARARNEAMLERLRPVIAPVTIDYEADVLPLTPSGNATERHMLAVMDTKAREMFPNPRDLAAYWSERTGLGVEEILGLLGDTARFRTAIRRKLMKKGGPGYVQPTPETFPPIGEVARAIAECGAIPCSTWLDGTRAGEADPDQLLDWHLAMGCIAMNIVPDRNWNIPDPEEKRLKTRKLAEIVQAARKRHLIFSVGTEMNNYGQKVVDGFETPELRPFAEDFRRGAYILYGHTILERACRKGLMSEWARETFRGDRARANAFYLRVGERAFPPLRALEALGQLPDEAAEPTIIEALERLGRP